MTDMFGGAGFTIWDLSCRGDACACCEAPKEPRTSMLGEGK